MTPIVLLASLLASPADAPPPSYAKEIDPLMRRYCASCHGKRMPRGGLSVINYDDLFKTKKGKVLIVPGKPEKSVLLGTMEGHDPVMPPPRTELQPTKADVARVRAWIAAGAKDDSPE